MVHVVTAELRVCVCVRVEGRCIVVGQATVLHEILKKKIAGARSVKQI